MMIGHHRIGQQKKCPKIAQENQDNSLTNLLPKGFRRDFLRIQNGSMFHTLSMLHRLTAFKMMCFNLTFMFQKLFISSKPISVN